MHAIVYTAATGAVVGVVRDAVIDGQRIKGSNMEMVTTAPYLLVENDPGEIGNINELSGAAILAGAKAAKKAEIAAAFDANIAGSVTVSLGYPMQFDTRDTLMVRGAIELAQATEQTSLYLTDANDVTHEGVSIAEAQATLMEMMAAFAAAHAKKQTLRGQIYAAQTVEDVEAVEW